MKDVNIIIIENMRESKPRRIHILIDAIAKDNLNWVLPLVYENHFRRMPNKKKSRMHDVNERKTMYYR